MTTDSNVVETIFKTKESYNECDHCQSFLSPAAYFVKLVETIEKYIPGHKLKERRPDLFELPLDCDSTNKTKLYLEIANEIMEKNLDKKLGGNALQKLATAKYPFNLPANFPLISIRAYLEKQGITLADLYKVLKPEANNVAESLGLSPEEYNLIIDAETTDSHLKEVYGIDKSELREAEKFIAQTNISYDELELLLDSYNKINKKPTNKLSINSGNIDNIDQALGFLHRFIRLANKLNWSFDELRKVLIAIGKGEIDANSLKEISRIKSLQEKLKKPLSEVCKLYSNASILIEEGKSKEDAKNAAESLFFLQGVKESDLKKIYGIEEPSEPFKEENFDEFIARTGANLQEVEWLLSQSTTQVKKAKKQEKISVKEKKFLHNFTQLAGQLKLLFGKLNMPIKELPSKFKLKDLVANVDKSNILQNIWNISKEELTSLINYNDKVSSKTGKLLIVEVHKQILLARLMNISIAEVIQILLQLNISELTMNNVEHVIELSDWLSNNSITIEQLSTLVNSSALSHKYTEQVRKICEELERDPKIKHDEKAFHNLVLQYIGEQLNEEGLAATHEFTKKQPTNLQLLRLESLDKSIVHDVGIIGQKAIFLGESKVLKKDPVEYSISEPRENVAVATVGAKTIFFGGKKSTNEYSKKIDIYDKDTGSWSTEVASEARGSAAVAVVDNKKAIFLGGNKNDKENAPNASEARSNASVEVIGDKAIFFGGEIGQERSSKIDIYENGNWRTHIASEARSNASVAIVDTKVIFFGGNKGSNQPSAKIDIYDAADIDIYRTDPMKRWTTHTVGEARENASVAIVDGKAIFFGGNKGSNQPSAKIDIYDAADIDIYRTDPMKRWTTHTVGEARENASVAIVDGKAIFFGGKADQTKSNKIDIYDAKTEKWLAVDYTASEARDAVSVTVVGKQAVFFGGCKGNQQYSKCIDVYDSATNSWKATGEINEAHENVSAIVIGTKAIFFTGKKNNTVTGQVYIYDSTSYSKDEDMAKSWIKRTAKENEMQDDLLVDITSSTKYYGKIDIYDDIAKSWKAIDLYKPDKCKSIRIHNNRATLTYQGTENKRTYTIGLSITYDVTIEELLNNAAVFATLKIDAEDITNHVDTYNLKVTWTENQIKTLANYKTLQDEFPGNELTLSQYVEWLRDSYDESKVTEKIAQLANWDKKLLSQIKEIDAFKKCFSKENHPIDSLLKIKSLVDMAEQTGIDGQILLELKDLHNLPSSTGWNKYNNIERKLRESLSYVEGVKEQLEDQKRNILANYMLHTYSEIKNKNVRGLYAFLLIDVEMSDCSKISPLKAGLNSLQLYIHRCILGLEEGATVNQELTEEMWDLLDNYREWEATKKVALYPENYLNPTLRKSATAEYKEFQNTLMQGNITYESAANAYIKYFEDFAQLVNLEKADVYFTDKTFYLMAKTQTEPYTYYYRSASFDGVTPDKWIAWQKIEAQIPVKKARIIHAFGKVFVFWLQKTEKEKQVGGISINDSTLTVNYAFKKVDGSWSAQQRLPYEINVSDQLTREIRECLSVKDSCDRQIEYCENKKKERSEGCYLKRGDDLRLIRDNEYSWWKDVVFGDWQVIDKVEYWDSIKRDYENKVKECEKSVKNKAEKSKEFNKNFHGKLAVILQGKSSIQDEQEILIVSVEEGFENSSFILNEDFSLTRKPNEDYYLNCADIEGKADEATIEAVIKKSFDKRKSKYAERVDNKDAKKAIERKINGLKDEKTKAVTQKKELQDKIDVIKQVANCEKQLDSFQQLELIGDNVPSPKGSITEGKFLVAVNNLKQRIADSKKNIEGKKAEMDATLTKLETDATGLIGKEDELQLKVQTLVNKLNALQQKESIQDGLLKKVIEKGKLQEVVDNLEERLIKSKETVIGKKVDVEKQLTDLEVEIGNLKGKENELQLTMQELLNGLNALQQKKLIQVTFPAISILVEKGKLDESVNALKQILLALRSSIDDKTVSIKNRLVDLEQEVVNLVEKINELIKEEVIKHLENELLKGRVLDDIKRELEKSTDGKVNNLDTEIEKKEEEKRTQDANVEVLQEKYNVELESKQNKSIALAKQLFNQGGKKIELEDTAEITKFINYSYKAAYIKGARAVLTPKDLEEGQLKKFDFGKFNFNGFYGVYLWEIFFHIPTLVAYLFNQEQKFAEARKWYQYIFNPLKKGCNAWQFIPFKDKRSSSNINDSCDSRELVDSLDPYKEAGKDGKVSFEKYIIISYVDNLIDWGDMLFSQASWEGINEATMLYIRAWDLLGEKPKKKEKFNTTPKSVCKVLTVNMEVLCVAELRVPVQSSGAAPSRTLPDNIEYCSYFCTPENKDFIGLWDRIKDRLYKIRHCLDIKGKRLELPLFQPPIDPKQLISAAAGGSTVRLPKIAQVPHYRFKYMITYAKSIADTVTQIGSELLSVLEKKDAEALNLFYNKQEAVMANLMTTIKEKAIEALKEEAKVLNTSLSSAKDRKSHYEKLIKNDLSSLERKAFDLAKEAIEKRIDSSTLRGLAAALHLIPTVFGLACGSFQPGSAAEIAAIVSESEAMRIEGTASEMVTKASYQRRKEDWSLQEIMATHDVEQIGCQIEANKINQANAVQDLKAHKESIKQIREKEEFFRSKFTNQELYSWMKGELKSLYIKTYRLALEVARQAEWAYQYEIDNDKAFIQPGHWNSLKEGLLSGQKLKFELEQLDKEYHKTNERRLEITKVISLKSLDPIALHELKTKGSCKFSFTEKLFDLDFPGHYARKIKDIKITIPAVVGPYENIHASLQQTSNQIVLKSEGAINAIKYLVNPSEEEQPETDLLRVNWKPNQEIAISKADQDSGLFELSFGDDRYLPFEGTGAISTWELSLPQATNRFDISTISDVIIHLDYTALNGGEVLSLQVRNLDQIKYYQGTLVVNLRAVYPAEWDKFKQQAKGSSSELKFKLSPEIFPVHVKNPSVDLDGNNNICVIPTTPDMSRITIKVNTYSWERNSKKIVNPSLTIGSDWTMKISNADINKIEEIMIMLPYKAPINW